MRDRCNSDCKHTRKQYHAANVLKGAILTKRLIVFGNGLGRAIDDMHFRLSTALDVAWESGVLSPEKKDALLRWAMLGAGESPKTEEQFGRIYVVMREAAKIRREHPVSAMDLTEDEMRSFCHAAACHFHDEAFSSADSEEKRAKFIATLIEHFAKKESSIATLNYDKLIYGAMVRAHFDNVLDFDDGFRKKGFPVFYPVVLKKAIDRGEPLYLHLHGSPLFLTSQNECGDDQIEKKPTWAIPKIAGSSQSHLILNNSYYKQFDIEKSPLLLSYWAAYRALVEKAERIFLVGYSGCDDHLNAVINILQKGNVTRVVEREWGKKCRVYGQKVTQKEYWDMVIPGSELITMPNILDFKAWEQ